MLLMQTDKCVTAHRGPGRLGCSGGRPCAGRREAPLFRMVLNPPGEGARWPSALPASYSLRQEAMGCPRAGAEAQRMLVLTVSPGELTHQPPAAWKAWLRGSPPADPIPLYGPHPGTPAPRHPSTSFHTQGGTFASQGGGDGQSIGAPGRGCS